MLFEGRPCAQCQQLRVAKGALCREEGNREGSRDGWADLGPKNTAYGVEECCGSS